MKEGEDESSNPSTLYALPGMENLRPLHHKKLVYLCIAVLLVLATLHHGNSLTETVATTQISFFPVYPVEITSEVEFIPSDHVRMVVSNHSLLWKEGARPPLSELMSSGRLGIRREANHLLDFAIVGHGKCGTTTILKWLKEHPECQVLKKETDNVFIGNVRGLVNRLYNELDDSDKLRRGYKFPQDIRSSRSLRTFKLKFPQTLLIVGIRHPVLWFESFYNFKLQNLSPSTNYSQVLGHPNEMIGKCNNLHAPETEVACLGTGKGRFHLHLAMLRKTKQLLGVENDLPGLRSYPYIPNPIFLVEVSQLSDSDRHRSEQLKRDLQLILGLQNKFHDPPEVSPGRKWNDTRVQEHKDSQKIDICHPDYLPVRRHLLEMSRNASIWIRKSGFLDHPTVMVSSRGHFEEVLETVWMKDPCESRNDSSLVTGGTIR